MISRWLGANDTIKELKRELVGTSLLNKQLFQELRAKCSENAPIPRPLIARNIQMLEAIHDIDIPTDTSTVRRQIDKVLNFLKGDQNNLHSENAQLELRELFHLLKNVSILPEDYQGEGLNLVFIPALFRGFRSKEPGNLTLSGGRLLSKTLLFFLGFLEGRFEKLPDDAFGNREDAKSALSDAIKYLEKSMNAISVEEWKELYHQAMTHLSHAPIISLDGIEVNGGIDPTKVTLPESIREMRRAGRTQNLEVNTHTVEERDATNSREALVHLIRNRTVYHLLMQLYKKFGGRKESSFSEVAKGILYVENEELDPKRYDIDPIDFKVRLEKKSEQFYKKMDSLINARENGLSSFTKTLLSWVILPILDSLGSILFHYAGRTAENLLETGMQLEYLHDYCNIMESVRDALVEEQQVFLDANYNHIHNQPGAAVNQKEAERLYINNINIRRGEGVNSSSIHRDFSRFFIDQLPSMELSNLIQKRREKNNFYLLQPAFFLLYHTSYYFEKIVSSILRLFLKSILYFFDPLEKMFSGGKSSSSGLVGKVQSAIKTSALQALKDANLSFLDTDKKVIQVQKRLGISEKRNIVMPLLQNWIWTTRVINASRNAHHLTPFFARHQDPNKIDIAIELLEDWISGQAVEKIEDVLNVIFDDLFKSESQNVQTFNICERLRKSIVEESEHTETSGAELETNTRVEIHKLTKNILHMGGELVFDHLTQSQPRETTSYIEWMKEQIFGVILPCYEAINSLELGFLMQIKDFLDYPEVSDELKELIRETLQLPEPLALSDLLDRFEDRRDIPSQLNLLLQKYRNPEASGVRLQQKKFLRAKIIAFENTWQTKETEMSHLKSVSSEHIRKMFGRLCGTMTRYKGALTDAIEASERVQELEKINAYARRFNRVVERAKRDLQNDEVRNSCISNLKVFYEQAKQVPLRECAQSVMDKMEERIRNLESIVNSYENTNKDKDALEKYGHALDEFSRAVENGSKHYGIFDFMPNRFACKLSDYEDTITKLEETVHKLPAQWQILLLPNGSIRNHSKNDLSSERAILENCMERWATFNRNISEREDRTRESLLGIAAIAPTNINRIGDHNRTAEQKLAECDHLRTQLDRIARGSFTMASISDYEVGQIRGALSDFNTRWKNIIDLFQEANIERRNQALRCIIGEKRFLQNLDLLIALLPKIEEYGLRERLQAIKEACSVGSTDNLGVLGELVNVENEGMRRQNALADVKELWRTLQAISQEEGEEVPVEQYQNLVGQERLRSIVTALGREIIEGPLHRFLQFCFEQNWEELDGFLRDQHNESIFQHRSGGLVRVWSDMLPQITNTNDFNNINAFFDSFTDLLTDEDAALGNILEGAKTFCQNRNLDGLQEHVRTENVDFLRLIEEKNERMNVQSNISALEEYVNNNHLATTLDRVRANLQTTKSALEKFIRYIETLKAYTKGNESSINERIDEMGNGMNDLIKRFRPLIAFLEDSDHLNDEERAQLEDLRTVMNYAHNGFLTDEERSHLNDMRNVIAYFEEVVAPIRAAQQRNIYQQLKDRTNFEELEGAVNRLFQNLDELNGLHPLTYVPLDPLNVKSLMTWFEWIVYNMIVNQTGSFRLAAENPLTLRAVSERVMHDLVTSERR